ncbi:ABC transporter ATP-binding protein [Lactobacillus corticis]|uniref:ABC-type quaternary amine transporter n=1 Tax=Lactobacillus corticis TaxID=2201249 RepID=A0A916QIG3_9LACO|nr:ABC transporter ATP-binding protein [Lactobacillus corticis]GFZ26157.1 spermidine/putrescine ABC transporter ATP-binding protein [Lactobacillus corticis]
MAELEVKQLSKSFDGKAKVLKDISFTIKDGEFVSILGSSGCGKTTTLRIIAGLLDQTSGQVIIDGQDISKVPVHKRNFGMVFQSYALFPHLTVFQNVAFGLKMRKLATNEINERVKEILNLTGLGELAQRYPAELSGGQQQRVSLARALVTKPRLLLMDEPLSNLDAKLRVKMREEIRRLQKQLKLTVVFVTHDQQECFAISDRVLIMNAGKIEQFDTPENIFHHPKSKFVANFIGYENFINIGEKVDERTFKTNDLILKTNEELRQAEVTTIRPENVQIVDEPDRENTLRGEIISSEYLGQSFSYLVRTVIGNIYVEEARHAPRSENDQIVLELPVKHLHVLYR